MNPSARIHAASKGRPTGWPVDLETQRFKLRSLVRSDASSKWVAWIGDAEAMKPLHMPARVATVEEISDHIGQFDNNIRLLIGIFAKESGDHIGFYMIEVDRQHALAAFHVFIGDRNWWGKGVVNETRAVLLDHFFDARGIEKVVGQPLQRNFAAILNYKKQGWQLEGVHRNHRRSVLTGKRIDQYTFGLQKQSWKAARKE
jgi:RimJ/RimL family protein N-acetyltransferase